MNVSKDFEKLIYCSLDSFSGLGVFELGSDESFRFIYKTITTYYTLSIY